MSTSPRRALSLLGLAAALGSCAVYKTTDADRFPCSTDADCYGKQPSCQPAPNPNGDPGHFCSACNLNATPNEFALCTGDADCDCPMQCLRGPESTATQEVLRCFKPCANSANCTAVTQTCNTDNDGICVPLP